MNDRTVVACVSPFLGILAVACEAGGGGETGDGVRNGVDVLVSADHQDWLPTEETPVFDVHIRAPAGSADTHVVSVPLDEPTRMDVAEGAWTLWAWYEWEDPDLVRDDPNGYISTQCEGEVSVDVPAVGYATVDVPTECTTQYGS